MNLVGYPYKITYVLNLFAFQHPCDRPPDWTAVVHSQKGDDGTNAQQKPVG